MIRYLVTVSAFLTALFLCVPARADSDFKVRPASSCPALFGTAGSRAENVKDRTRYLELVEPIEDVINLTYSGPWREPIPVRFKGITMTASLGIGGDSPSAILEISDMPPGVSCEPGLYEIHVDDSLGSDAHVLAIVKNAVLFERDGQLFYLTARMAQEPIFRMIWRSTWTISGEQQKSNSAMRPSSNRNYHRPKPIKHSSSPARPGLKSTIRR